MQRREQILDIIARVSGADRGRLTPDMDLVADLGLDSAKAIELVVTLEDALEIEVDEEAAADLNTVGDILEQLTRT